MQVNKLFQSVFSVFTGVIVGLTASGAEVLSSRPAGVVKISLNANEQKVVSIPFSPFDSSLEAVFAGQLKGTPEGSGSDLVYKWDSSTLQYVYAAKADGTGDSDVDGKWYSSLNPLVPANMSLKPGDGFVIWNRQGQVQDVYLAGDVVLDETNKVVLNPALNMVGYPYSSRSKVPSNMVFTSDTSTGYVEKTNLEMGCGYWVQNTNLSAEVWTEIRPYAAGVFPPQGTRPDILWINVNSDGVSSGRVELVLTIDCEGLAADEKLDVYFKDVASDGTFEPDGSWLIAEKDIPVKDRKTFEWMDSSVSDLNSKVSGLDTQSVRYYLIGRASVDEDHDGIPDARQRFVLKKTVVGMPLRVNDTQTVISAAQDLQPSVSASVVSTPRVSRIIYVDRKHGADHFTGKSETVVSSAGPKKTVKGGLNAVGPGDAMVIKDGVYGENLNISGKDVKVFIEGKVRL